MGSLLFILAVVVEAILMVFCLRTRSQQIRAKGLVRLGTLTGFALLVALGVIDWGTRYYALAAFLLLVTIIGIVSSIRKQEVAFRAGRVVLRAIGMTVLLFAATLPVMLFPQYSLLTTTGRYQVSTAISTYVDTSRVETYANTGEYRKLNVGFWYPAAGDGRYPLVVFSHGGISHMGSNESLYHELASHGYVVASIDHTYHAISVAGADGQTTWIDRGYLRELMVENAKTNRNQSYEYYQKWMKIRMDDINFVIDSIRTEAHKDKPDSLYRFVDAAVVGVMGHSLGGSAALGVGRVRDDVGAVIALESPFLYDVEGVKNGEFVFAGEAYPAPVLNVYSDTSWSSLGTLPQYAQNHALLSDNQADAFNVHISGVGHFSLTDLALSSPALTRFLNRSPSMTDAEDCLRTINKVCLAFFDSYLKKTGEFSASPSLAK